MSDEANKRMMEGCSQHLRWVDSWKGILILLVILGHAVGGAAHLVPDKGMSQAFCYQAYKVIYTFHMAAFFAVAGLLWKRAEVPFQEFFWKKFSRLIVPYFIFGILSVLILFLFESVLSSAKQYDTTGYYATKGFSSYLQPFLSLLHAGGWPRGEGFRANGVLWFLPCFFMVQLAFWGLGKWIWQMDWKCVLAIALCFMLGFFMRRFGLWGKLPWGLGKVPYYLGFMLVGRWFLPGAVEAFGRLKSRWWQFAATAVLTIGYAWALMHFPDLSVAFVHVGWYAAYGAMALMGIVLSAMWGQVLECRMLSVLGVLSLGIMLTHKFIVVAMEIKMGWIRGLFAGDFMWCLMGIMVVMMTAVVVSVVGAGLVAGFWPFALGLRSKIDFRSAGK